MNYSRNRNRHEYERNAFEPEQEDEKGRFNPQGKNLRNNRRQPQMETKKKIDQTQKLLSYTNALIFGSKTKKQTNGKRDYNANQEEPKQIPQVNSAPIYRKQNQQFKESKDHELDVYQKAGRPRGGEREAPPTRPIIQQHHDQESKWSIQQSDKEDRNTSETNKKQDPIHLKAEEFPNIQETMPEKPTRGRTRGNRQGSMRNQGQRKDTQNRNSGKKVEEKILDLISSSSEEPQQSHLSSLNNGRLAFDSHDISVTALTNLLDQEEPAAENNSPAVQPKARPIQEIKQSLKELTSQKKAKVSLVFEVEDNILQFGVKEIQLVPLAVAATIASGGQIRLKKYPGIGGQLQKYITIIDPSHYFPNFPNAPQEHVHKAVEGEDEPLPINLPRAELELCRVSCKSADSGNKLAGNSLLVVRLAMIRCMQCHAKNEVAVPTSNELGCSCHRCSAKMLGRVVEVRAEE